MVRLFRWVCLQSCEQIFDLGSLVHQSEVRGSGRNVSTYFHVYFTQIDLRSEREGEPGCVVHYKLYSCLAIVTKD